MLRSYTSTGSTNMAMNAVQSSAAQIGTFACCAYLTAVGAFDGYFGMIQADATTRAGNMRISGTPRLSWAGGGGDNDSTLTPPTNVWTLFGVTHTGSVLRAHLLNYSTGTWSHSAITGSTADVGAYWRIGRANDTSTQGNIAATGWWPQAMSDSEFERLARGNWVSMEAGDVFEFGPNDRPGWLRDLGRQQSKFNVETNCTKGTRSGPPGFRFGPQDRRR